MQSRPVLSAFCSLPLNHGSVHMLGEAAPIAATYLLIHLVKWKFICPLRAIMLAEGRSTAEVLVLRHFFFYILATLNCNFTKEPCLKCDRHTGAICMETACQACPGKAVLLKTSWKIATVGAFSWVSGLKKTDNWEDVKSRPPPRSPDLVIYPASFTFFTQPSSWQLYSVFLDPDLKLPEKPYFVLFSAKIRDPF